MKKRFSDTFKIFSSIGLLLFLSSCSPIDDSGNEAKISEKAFLYASTNSGIVKRYNINSGDQITFNTASEDAGVVVYEGGDLLTLLSRSSSQLQLYSGASAVDRGSTIDLHLEYSGTQDFQNSVDMAMSANYYVVSDNTDVDGDSSTANGVLYVYRKGSTGFVLRNFMITNFNLGGLEFVGNDLYAAVKNTNKVALFKNFLESNTSRGITADKIISFEGMINIQGLDYENGTMLLSDIGDKNLDSDGALNIINDFDSKYNVTSNLGILSIDEQLRIAGNKTKLGNPVNIDYDTDYNVIFVTEALNGGGKILAFNNARNASGNISPDLSYNLAGVSSVYFYTE